jgi:hypothetical protein
VALFAMMSLAHLSTHTPLFVFTAFLKSFPSINCSHNPLLVAEFANHSTAWVHI